MMWRQPLSQQHSLRPPPLVATGSAASIAGSSAGCTFVSVSGAAGVCVSVMVCAGSCCRSVSFWAAAGVVEDSITKACVFVPGRTSVRKW